MLWFHMLWSIHLKQEVKEGLCRRPWMISTTANSIRDMPHFTPNLKQVTWLDLIMQPGIRARFQLGLIPHCHFVHCDFVVFSIQKHRLPTTWSPRWLVLAVFPSFPWQLHYTSWTGVGTDRRLTWANKIKLSLSLCSFGNCMTNCMK